MKKVEDYFLYNHQKDVDSLIAQIENFTTAAPISAIVLTTDDDLINVLNSWLPERFKHEIKPNGEYVWNINIECEIIHKNARTIGGKANIIKHHEAGVYIVITHESSDFIEHCLITFFDKYYPKISRANLSSNQLREILDKLKDKTGSNIQVDKFVAYRQGVLGGGIVEYTKRDYVDAFESAAREDAWIDKIDFRLKSGDNELILNGHLSRKGLFKYREGSKDVFRKIFYDGVINNVSLIASKNLKFYSNRSRSLADLSPKPIVIEYGHNVFEDKKENSVLIDVFSKLTYSSCSVFHGNPYVHLSLVDHKDGSSYDIWVLSTNCITIVPQLRASFSSLKRICDHISEHFREGLIKEYEVQNEC